MKILLNEFVGGYKYLKNVKTWWKFVWEILETFGKISESFEKNLEKFVKILENYWEKFRKFKKFLENFKNSVISNKKF